MRIPVPVLVAIALATTARAASSQLPSDTTLDHPHTYAFTNGDPAGWTFGPPHIDVAAGYYNIHEAGSSEGAIFFRAHAQLAIKSRYLQLSSDIQFVPKFTKANPTASFVLQVAPLAVQSHFYFSAGAGLITSHTASGAAAGWVQAQLAYRTPLHAFAVFGQIGHALNSGAGTELLFGLQHPLGPYRAHGLKS